MKALRKLSDEQKQLFEKVYEQHAASMGTEMRKKYSKENVDVVIWVRSEKCLHVHFKDGEWWRYGLNGTWY